MNNVAWKILPACGILFTLLELSTCSRLLRLTLIAFGYYNVFGIFTSFQDTKDAQRQTCRFPD